MSSNEGKKRVLILGAGSAGLSAALELERASASLPELEVTLVDHQNYHLFLPLLYQVVTGGVEPGHICFPVRSLLRKGGTAGPILFTESSIQSIELEKKKVITRDGELGWDYLVVALGSTTNFFGLDDVEKNALPLKSLSDGISIHNHILDNYEAALREGDEERRRELLTFVVVGGGATGVELTASIQDFVRKVLIRDFPSLTPRVRVILAEARDRILPEMKAEMTEVALRRLCSQGVEVLLDTRITKAWSRGIETNHGQTIPTSTVIWAAGVKPVAVVESLPLDKAKDGRILVNRNLEPPTTPGVYIAGDCTYLLQEPGSEPYPPTGQIAVRQGLACARNIVNAIAGKPQLPFRYKYKGELISMGRNVAIAQIGNRAFDGFAAWLLWRVYYLGKLMGFKSKLSVALDWSFAYMYRRNTARLE
jgi:NADH dehydrogenase